ncbi:MAG: hypothetical protein AB7S50_01115 [Bacteroidales bacterium]
MKTKLLIFLILFTACKSLHETKTNIQKPPVEIEIVQVENEMIFTLTNNSTDTIRVINPKKLNLQRMQDNEWQNLKILNCPCDAPCNAPKESISIDSNQQYIFKWNKKESWCGKRTSYSIRETIEQPVDPGNFKVLISVKKQDQSIEIISKEFEIK